MKRRKAISLLLGAVMVTGMLGGCSGSEVPKETAQGSGDSSQTPTESVADPNAKYEEPVTLTSFFEISPTIASIFTEEGIQNSYYTKQQEEQTNIHIDYLWYASDTPEDAEQKKNVAIASGEIPDFMLVDSAQLALLAKSDLINKDIYSVYEAYASDTLKQWTVQQGESVLDSATYDGKIIAIPLVDSAIDAASFLWIRQDWLDKLGLERPTTMEELYDVMVAFKTQDPDGNGVDDTVGLITHKNFLSNGLADMVGIFNAYGAYPTDWVEDGNGGLMYGSTTPEAKEALGYIAKMYAEGLIQEDFSAIDDSKSTELVASNRGGIQYGAMWNAIWPLAMSLDADPEADWCALPIPTATDEPAKSQVSVRVVNYAVVSAECEHPEVVIKLLNFWCHTQTELSDEEWNKYLEPGADGVVSFPLHSVMLKTWNPEKNYDQYLAIKDALETGDTSKLNPEFLTGYNDVKGYMDGDASKYGQYKTFAPEGSAFAAMDEYVKTDAFHYDAFTGASTPAMTQKLSIVTDKVMEYYTKVIMGTASLDDYDAFVEEVNGLGLAEITKEVNEWYKNR